LTDPRPVLVRRISRLAARSFVESLEDFGLAGSVEAAGTVAPPKAPATRRMVLGAVLTVAAVAAALLRATNHKSLPVHRGTAQLTTISRARALPWSAPRPPLSLKDLSALAAPSVVGIRCGDRRSTGFFVARDVVLAGFAATLGCSAMNIALTGARTLDGVVTRQDSRLGLALVKVAGSGTEPLRLGDAASLQSGGRVIIPSAPGTEAGSLHEARLGVGVHLIHGLVHLPIEGGLPADATGAPVLDDQGYVMGVIAPLEETAGETLFLPINYTFDESNLLARPVPGPDLQRWKALLTEVDLTEKLRVEPSQTPGAPPPESSPSTQ